MTVEDFKPNSDLVTILVPKIKDRTDKGVLKSDKMIEDEAKELSQFFKIVSVGDTVKNAKVGEYALPVMERTRKLPIDLDNEDFNTCVVREFDIYGFSAVQ